MAKHSHWANIKHKKAANDARRGAVIAKMGKLITVAVQAGGSSLTDNPRLRLAVEKARAAGMANDPIERAIKKAAGEGKDGRQMVELSYEGYGPGGVALVVDCLTDNRTRTAPEIKKLFERGDGSVGTPGCVAWQFKTKSLFLVGSDAKPAREDQLMDLLLSGGADPEDIAQQDATQVAITAAPDRFDAIAKLLASAGIDIASSEIAKVPETTLAITDPAIVTAVSALIDSLDAHDDVQSVVHNAEL